MKHLHLVSRANAMRLGMKRYVSGRECPQGHLGERFVGGQCVECQISRNADWQRENKCHVRAYQASRQDVILAQRRVRYQNSPELQREKSLASYHANASERRVKFKEWRQNNSGRVRAVNRAWREANADYLREYARTNSAKINANSKARRARLIMALPGWLTAADFDLIRSIYADAARLSKSTGVAHHVDHEIPLRGRLVCGLHVPANLRVVTAAINLSKGNRYEL